MRACGLQRTHWGGFRCTLALLPLTIGTARHPRSTSGGPLPAPRLEAAGGKYSAHPAGYLASASPLLALSARPAAMARSARARDGQVRAPLYAFGGSPVW